MSVGNPAEAAVRRKIRRLDRSLGLPEEQYHSSHRKWTPMLHISLFPKSCLGVESRQHGLGGRRRGLS